MPDPVPPEPNPAPEPPAAPGSGEEFRQLLAACIDAIAERGPDAAEALLQAQPQHAARLRERLAKLARAGLLTTGAPPADDAIPEQLGEYRLQQRLGAGGMGVVYQAEQTSLKRTVALKLVRPEQRFFPGARERFRREVEAIARLGDPGIVPIYAVGEAEGIDYFTMELVRGASLADVLAAVHGTPVAELDGTAVLRAAAAKAGAPVPTPAPALFDGTWEQVVCRLLVRMARAAQHAHERGVVHRDLKPSNAMVTPDGRVLLLDFGLAAAQGAARITRSGAQLGTLHYMAPEQLDGGDPDARTDVYALGVCLHELLALQPPFHADQGERLRQLILLGDAAPLRLHNPNVPKDLATVCATAMEREPERRYPSAQALAADLERFLAHRPIQARPAGPALRLWRWSQRHPTLATTVALLFVFGASLPIGIHIVQQETEAARRTAEASSRQNLQNAVDAIVRMVQQARSREMSQTPGMDPMRLRQLEDAVELMRALAAQNQGDPAVAALLARGLLQSARVRLQLGQAERALQALDEAAPLLQAERQRRPDDPQWAVEAAALALNRASGCVVLGRLQEARRLWQGLLDEYQGAAPEQLPVDVVAALTSCHNNLGRMLGSEGDRDGALAALRRGLELDAIVRRTRNDVDTRIDSAVMRINLGTLLRQTGDPQGALREYQQVVAELVALAGEQPASPGIKVELARARFAAAQLQTQQQDFAAAKGWRDQALAELRAVAKAYPDRGIYAQDLAKMLLSSSNDLLAAGDLAGAEALAREAVATQEPQVAGQPNAPGPRADLAVFLRQVAVLRRRQNDLTGGLPLLERARSLLAETAARQPDDPYYRYELAGIDQDLGWAQAQAEQWPTARDVLRRSADAFAALLDGGYTKAREPRGLPLTLQLLAQAELMCDDFDAVVAALRRLQAVQPLPAKSLRQVGKGLHVDTRADFQALVAEAEARDAKAPATGK